MPMVVRILILDSNTGSHSLKAQDQKNRTQLEEGRRGKVTEARGEGRCTTMEHRNDWRPDDAYPGRKLYPFDPYERARQKMLLELFYKVCSIF